MFNIFLWKFSLADIKVHKSLSQSNGQSEVYGDVNPTQQQVSNFLPERRFKKLKKSSLYGLGDLKKFYCLV